MKENDKIFTYDVNSSSALSIYDEKTIKGVKIDFFESVLENFRKDWCFGHDTIGSINLYETISTRINTREAIIECQRPYSICLKKF